MLAGGVSRRVVVRGRARSRVGDRLGKVGGGESVEGGESQTTVTTGGV